MSARPPALPCERVTIEPGPSGLETLHVALRGVLAEGARAIAVLPAYGGVAYRDSLETAVRPGAAVPAGVAVVLATSGSTGAPAGVLMSAESLRAASAAFGARTGAPGGHRWVAALPVHHAGGFMVVVRSYFAGTQPLGLASLGGAVSFSVDDFATVTVRARELSRGDGLPLAVSLVPAMLATLDAAGPRGWDALAEYSVVLVGGAAVAEALVDRLRSKGVQIRASYGMTETCGGAVLDGEPFANVQITADSAGRLRICGPQVALGYRDGRLPERWRSSDGVRSFLSDDLGQVRDDGQVLVTGRFDDVVQVGGASVSPAAVAAVICRDARIADAQVVSLSDARRGSVLVAFVLLVDSSGDGQLDLAHDVEAALGRAARPTRIQVLSAFPLLPSGKTDRRALEALARRPNVGSDANPGFRENGAGA